MTNGSDSSMCLTWGHVTHIQPRMSVELVTTFCIGFCRRFVVGGGEILIIASSPTTGFVFGMHQSTRSKHRISKKIKSSPILVAPIELNLSLIITVRHEGNIILMPWSAFEIHAHGTTLCIKKSGHFMIAFCNICCLKTKLLIFLSKFCYNKLYWSWATSVIYSLLEWPDSLYFAFNEYYLLSTTVLVYVNISFTNVTGNLSLQNCCKDINFLGLVMTAKLNLLWNI